MSKGNKKFFYILSILILFSLFAFGCKVSKTSVESINFDLTDFGGEEITLVVGEEYRPKISFVPSFATDKGYTFLTSNEDVLQVVGSGLLAKQAGNAALTVVASDNNAIQSVVMVKVYESPIKLGGNNIDDAINLHYNEIEKKFVFSEVLGAAGYTININGNKIELGNVFEFSLEEYAKQHQAYDTELIVQVRANAPVNNHAVLSSDFSSPVRIYQVSEVYDVRIAAVDEQSYLSFNHNVAKQFNITINGEPQPDWQYISNKSVSVMQLQEKYAGQTIALQISALIDDEIRTHYPAALCFPSLSKEYAINVLDVPEVSLTASYAVWDAIPYAAKYNVLLNGAKVQETESCSFNLNDLQEISSGQVYELSVEPIISGANLAKTSKKNNALKISRNNSPVLKIENENLIWQQENSQYFVEILNGERAESYSTTNAQVDLSSVGTSPCQIKITKLANYVDGVYYLSSLPTQIEITRLKTPSLSYNKLENKFYITDENAERNVKNYSISFLENETITTSKDLTEFNPQINVGENLFTIKAESNGEVDGVNYLPSKQFSLTITKIEQAVDISLGTNEPTLEDENEFFNFIKIETNLNDEYNLELQFKQNGTTLLFKTENNNLVSADGKGYSLPFVFLNKCYYVSLLNAQFEPIISELKNKTAQVVSTSISVALSREENNFVSSDQLVKEFSICGKTELKANGQNVEFLNINPSSQLTDYYLLINKQILINLNENNSSINGENIVVDIKKLVNSCLDRLDLAREIDLTILNTFSNSILSASKTFKIQFSNTPTINVQKNVLDNNANNCIEISATKFLTDYTKQYVFKIYNENEKATKVLSFDENSTAKFNLEDILLELENYVVGENVYVSAYISVLSQAQDTQTYVFNSFETEPIKFNQLAEVTNLKINDGILTFSSENEGVAYFEIYTASSGIYTKVGTSKTTSFDLSNLKIVEQFNLSVKAIANLNEARPSVANSNFSQQISAQIIDFSVNVEKGDFVLKSAQFSLLKQLKSSQGEQNFAYVEIENLSSNARLKFDLSIEQEGVIFDEANNQIFVEAYLILNYVELSTENLSFKIGVNYLEEQQEFYYINSSPQLISAKGLLKPSNLDVKFITDTNEEIVDYLDWFNLKNPTEISYSYVLRITYNDKTYSSLNGTFFCQDDAIDFENNKIKLPTKFVSVSNENVEFGKGEYYVEIKIYSTSKSDSTYCSSAYAKAKINLLAAPEPSVKNGCAVWDKNDDAQGYQLKIEINANKTPQYVYITTTEPSFDFNSGILENVNGVLSFQVKAISQLKNQQDNGILKGVANSAWSESLQVYKLSNFANFAIDDGAFVLTANKFFAAAEIEFVYNGISTTYVLDNESFANEQLNSLQLDGWANLSSENEEKFKELKNYIVDLNKIDKNNNKINLLEGTTYSIFVKLIGNSNETLPIVNSCKTKAELTATKLQKVSAQAVERGRINFSVNSQLAVDKLNYNFNETEPMLIDLQNVSAKVYKIDITINNNFYSIYALDYNYFINKIQTLAEDSYCVYEQDYSTLYGHLKLTSGEQEIYLNVFENNILDFTQTSLFYNEIVCINQDGKFVYSMPSKNVKNVELTSSGTFLVDVFLLGGDNLENYAYITSVVQQRYLVRYALNSAQVSNGEIRFKDLIPTDTSGEILDYPIYKILANSTLSNKTFYLYYPQSNLEKVEALIGDANATYIEIVNFQQEENNRYVWFAISDYLDGATYYNIKIQTLAGLGINNNSNYLLNAVSVGENIYLYKLDYATLAVDESLGAQLKFSANDNRSLKFEISLTDLASNKKIVYSIDESSNNVKLKNNYILYTLPKTLNLDDEEISLNSSYKIEIRVLSNGQAILNGSYNSLSLNVKRAEDIETFAIQNGVLVYKSPKISKQVYVQLKYSLDGTEKRLYFLDNADLNLEYKSYNFSDFAIYSSEDGQFKEVVVPDKIYKLNIFALGYVDDNLIVLNGAFNETELDAIRLETVSAVNSINGILNWKAVENAKRYSISISKGNEVVLTKETENDETNISLDELEADKYLISVRALGDEFIHSIVSQQFEFIKLEKVDVNTLTFNTNRIEWTAVENADFYTLEFEFNVGEQSVVEQLTALTNWCEMPAQLRGNYTLKIKACSNLSNILNSNTAIYTSSLAVPNPVKTIEWESDLARFKIVVDEDFDISDQINVISSLKKYNYTNGQSVLGEQEQIQQPEIIPYTAQNNGVYYYYPSIVGQYSQISFRINRAKSLSSSTVVYRSLDFHPYCSGDGSDANPYIILNANNLQNISLRPNANFVLNSNISIAQLEDYNVVVANEFSGKFNGNGYSIYDFSLSLQNSNLSLFKNLNNATISNLNLGGENNTISINYTNFENVYVSILAQNATNSTFNNIKLNKTTLNITGSLTNSSVNIAGLVANSTNSSFAGCQTELVVSYGLQSSGNKAVGGIVARASGGKFTRYTDRTIVNTTAKLTLNYTSNAANCEISYLGGLVGEYRSADISGSVEDCQVTVEFNNLIVSNSATSNVGGIAGYSSYNEIKNSTVSGNISVVKLYSQNRINLGGIVGLMQSSVLNGAEVNVQFAIEIASGSIDNNTVRLGVLVGEISKIPSQLANEIKNCYSRTQFKQGLTNLSPFEMGVYGYLQLDALSGSAECTLKN